MELVITRKTVDGKINLVESTDGRFKYNSFSNGYIEDTKLNESIYNLGYCNKESMGSREITDQKEIDIIINFRMSLQALKEKNKNELWEKELNTFHNKKSDPPQPDSLCPKCQTYCCGDCGSY